MSPRLDRVIPDIHKGKGAVQWPNSSLWKIKKKEVSYTRNNPLRRKHGATEKSKGLGMAEIELKPSDGHMGLRKWHGCMRDGRNMQRGYYQKSQGDIYLIHKVEPVFLM